MANKHKPRRPTDRPDDPEGMNGDQQNEQEKAETGQDDRDTSDSEEEPDVEVIDTSDLDPALNIEQRMMEHHRKEEGSRIRGTGDKPAPVHGRTRPVETSNTGGVSVATSARQVRDHLRTRGRQTVAVKATKLGYYDDIRRRTGDVFRIRAPYESVNEDGETITIDEYSTNWMEPVDASTPERITTGTEDLRRQHDEILRARSPQQLTRDDHPTGSADVLGE